MRRSRRPLDRDLVAVLALAAALAMAAPGAVAAAESHPISVHDLVTVERISDPRVSPDGRRVAYVVRSTDLTANRGRTDLWLAEVAGGGEPRRLTSDPANDSEPRWALIALGTVHSLAGNLDQAVTLAFQAAATIDPQEDPHAYLGARYNLAFYLHSAGRSQEAIEVLTCDLDLYERCRDPALAVRMRWLQGRLAAALGDPEAAEEAFLEVRAYFEAAGHASSFAAVCLDLALLHLEAGHYPSVAAAAAEAVAYFRSQGVDREVLAGLLLLEEAAREERVTAQQIRWLARRLETARPAPRQPPEEPS